MSAPKKTTLKRKLKEENIDKKTNVKKSKTCATSSQIGEPHEPQWSDHELLAEQHGLDLDVSLNLVRLFEDGNTVPFIARYRRAVTGNMSPDDVRAAKETYEEISVLKNKITTVLKSLHKSNLMNDSLRRTVTSSRSIEELEYVYAPYKAGSKRTLAERAKELGLEEPAMMLLQNTHKPNLCDYIIKNKDAVKDIEAVEDGIVHIIAAVISTDTEILTALRELRKESHFIVKTTKKVSKTTPNEADHSKFDNYADFEAPVKHIKPHQVLAINRGENLKILTVKIIVPDRIPQQFQRLCSNKWLRLGSTYESRVAILKKSFQDAYTRLVEPLLKREIRAELKQAAERASCEVFSTNLKHLLLAAPIKGKYVLGIDPGFTNGCKMALISPMGDLVESAIINPHRAFSQERDVAILKKLLLENGCELIALGNGTACRQTEEWLSKLIQKRVFQPLDVKYTVVREDGASIYSCGPEAKKEFEDLDPNIISAVSLARRVQEPLAELIKVEPKHLGVGMYQHDVKKKHLDEALNDVVSECVSFVGVDLNTASQCLLKHVAGLTDKRAEQIIKHRTKKGPFMCRRQLLEVTGIGPKVFQQCAGFLRVGPVKVDEEMGFYKNSKATKLDCSNIHPESYDIALKVMRKFHVKVDDMGEGHFINIVKEEMKNSEALKLADELHTNEQTVQLVLDTLCKPLNHDLRNDGPREPLFKKGLTSINDLKVGSVLTGVISNVTHFGCFVDIGVGVNGLIHVSKYGGFDLNLGNKVEVKIVSLEIGKKRIGLQALRLI